MNLRHKVINFSDVYILDDLMDFHSQECDSKVIIGDLSLEPFNPNIASFMNDQNLFNFLQKNNTCFKSEGFCIDVISTNKKYFFKDICSFETWLNDHHHFIYSVMKTTFKSEEFKKKKVSLLFKFILRMFQGWFYVQHLWRKTWLLRFREKNSRQT